MKSKIPSKLIVAVLSMVNVMNLNKTVDSKYEITGGVEGKALIDAMKALGMEYELVVPPDGEYGRKNFKGKWTGLIGMVERGEVDLAFSGLLMSPERGTVVEFTKPYAMITVNFAISKSERVRLKNAYLYPFRFPVWACFCFLFFVMASAMWIVLEKKYSFWRIVFEISANILRQPFGLGCGSWKSKFLLAVIGLYILVITSGYSGILLSFMTVPMQGKDVETLEQLSDAVAKGTHRFHVVKGTALVPYLLIAKEKHMQLLGKEINRNKWYLDDNVGSMAKMIGPNDAIVSTNLVFNFIFRGTPQEKEKYLMSKDSLTLSILGAAMSRKFCCKKKLNKIITRFVEAGMMDKYVREVAFETWVKNKQEEEEVEEKEHKLSIEDISGALIILCVGYAISLLTLLAEILVFKYGVNNHRCCRSK